MSHCTKFDFSFASERTIVKAFKKMGIPCTTGIVSNKRQSASTAKRAIYGNKGEFIIVLYKESDDNYILIIEKESRLTDSDKRIIPIISEEFRHAYIEVAIDKITEKLEKGGMPTEVKKNGDKFVVNFGPMHEYSLSVVFDNGQLIEDVHGVKGDFCTKLTEDLEEILSSPTAELNTAWKEEYEMPLEDQNIQVLSLSF